ncbi:MAG: hypothetical protein MR516_01365, partial [Bacteroidales bacterium]|nr:hypothetical protein [Bacteroidales bacterium]
MDFIRPFSPWHRSNPLGFGATHLASRKVGFHPTFSRHGIAQILSALALLIWLHEKVGFHPTFSRHGIAQILSALALLIWLN